MPAYSRTNDTVNAFHAATFARLLGNSLGLLHVIEQNLQGVHHMWALIFVNCAATLYNDPARVKPKMYSNKSHSHGQRKQNKLNFYLHVNYAVRHKNYGSYSSHYGHKLHNSSLHAPFT